MTRPKALAAILSPDQLAAFEPARAASGYPPESPEAIAAGFDAMQVRAEQLPALLDHFAPKVVEQQAAATYAAAWGAPSDRTKATTALAEDPPEPRLSDDELIAAAGWL